MRYKRVQRNFTPWPKNQERLELADRLGLNAGELINELLEQHFKTHLESKVKEIREALSVP